MGIIMSMRMPSVDTTKKPARKSWHPADIKAALEKSGWSLRRLAIANGYADKSLSLVLRRPWPKVERIVADAIGVPAKRIWPHRYRSDGTPKSGRGERGLGRGSRSEDSTGVNVHAKGAR